MEEVAVDIAEEVASEAADQGRDRAVLNVQVIQPAYKTVKEVGESQAL